MKNEKFSIYVYSSNEKQNLFGNKNCDNHLNFVFISN
jgi:hypothetical protein